MKKIIKLYDECVRLYLRAQYERNNTCLTSDQQEEAYERLTFDAHEAESKLFAEIRKLKGKAPKKEKSQDAAPVVLVQPLVVSWPYPPT